MSDWIYSVSKIKPFPYTVNTIPDSISLRNYLLPLLFSLLSATFLYANDEDRKGIITGKVTTSDGQVAEAVSITLQGTGTYGLLINLLKAG
ncbi:MAG TPA: hypothetical protein VN824_07145 [Puia sp.]|nr:hypothetical protein [Puia sp.]